MTDSSFDAVFYREPVVGSSATLTLLGLIFDRLIFPDVHIPFEGVDREATVAEIQRLQAMPPRSPDSVQIINMMIYAVNAQHIKDFCVFTGTANGLSGMERETGKLVHELQELIYGPPPEGFIPTIEFNFSKGLPGSDDRPSICSPGWIAYPANALLYAARTGTVLVNDDPAFPMLGLGQTDIRAQARVLASVLALESVRLVLPQLKEMSFEQLAEFRSETADIVKPFRRAMLRLSKELSTMLVSDSSLADVHRQARFLVETTVLPDLDELRQALNQPSKPWYRRAVDLTKSAPELAGNFLTMPRSIATAKVLARIAEMLADVRDGQLEREGMAKRGAFHYLLKIERAARK